MVVHQRWCNRRCVGGRHTQVRWYEEPLTLAVAAIVANLSLSLAARSARRQLPGPAGTASTTPGSSPPARCGISDADITLTTIAGETLRQVSTCSEQLHLLPQGRPSLMPAPAKGALIVTSAAEEGL